jgi:hypothetical protein
MKDPLTHEPETMDPVHGTVNLFHMIFLRKIIYLILENSMHLDFCRKTLNFILFMF